MERLFKWACDIPSRSPRDMTEELEVLRAVASCARVVLQQRIRNGGSGVKAEAWNALFDALVSVGGSDGGEGPVTEATNTTPRGA